MNKRKDKVMADITVSKIYKSMFKCFIFSVFSLQKVCAKEFVVDTDTFYNCRDLVFPIDPKVQC